MEENNNLQTSQNEIAEPIITPTQDDINALIEQADALITEQTETHADSLPASDSVSAEPGSSLPQLQPDQSEDSLVATQTIPLTEMPEMERSDIIVTDEPDSNVPPVTPVRKRRPARKSGYGFFGIPQIAASLVWLALVVVIGISLGRLLWVCAADVLAFGREDKAVTITITADDDLDSIADKLHKGGLIRYPKLFIQYAKLAHVVEKEKISTGTFTLNTIYDYNALVNSMSSYSSFREEVKDLLIPEGYTCDQIFRLLDERGVCSAEALRDYAANGELDDFWFLEGVQRGTPNCLEGFLFPDTYNFYLDDSPRRVLEKLLYTFDYRFDENMKEEIISLNERMAEKMYDNGYDEDYVESHYFDVRKIITIASLIEKESAGVVESYTISSVFYNRLTDLGNYPYLNSDAALYYALGGASEHELTLQDLQSDSPYNTYNHIGLIPGPIANPGRNSIYAALDPDDTDYHFFIYNREEGQHHFSETLSEHEAYAESLNYD